MLEFSILLSFQYFLYSESESNRDKYRFDFKKQTREAHEIWNLKSPFFLETEIDWIRIIDFLKGLEDGRGMGQV